MFINFFHYFMCLPLTIKINVTKLTCYKTFCTYICMYKDGSYTNNKRDFLFMRNK